MRVLVRVISTGLTDTGNDESELSLIVVDLLAPRINQAEPLPMRRDPPVIVIIAVIRLGLRPA